jgi:hypothetical protein
MKKWLLPLAFFISVITSTLLATSFLRIGAGLSNQFITKQTTRQKAKNNSAAFTIKLLNAEGGTFGYEIYSKTKLVIRQINIPGQSGTKGIMPPTVERVEMEKLGVEK